MKSLKITIPVIVLLAIFTTACNDDEDNLKTQELELTDEEAAELIVSDVVPDIDQMAGSSLYLMDPLEAEEGRVALELCGTAYDTLVDHSYEGTYQDFDLEVRYGYSFACVDQIPDTLKVNYELNLTREGIRTSTARAATGTYDVTGLWMSDAYVINGSSTSTGTTVLVERQNQEILNSNGALELTDVLIDNESYKVVGGTASYQLQGSSSRGGSFSYSVSIDFGEEHTAVITFNDRSFEVDLTTGQFTAL
jgi:hypothetical protein